MNGQKVHAACSQTIKCALIFLCAGGGLPGPGAAAGETNKGDLYSLALMDFALISKKDVFWKSEADTLAVSAEFFQNADFSEQTKGAKDKGLRFPKIDRNMQIVKSDVGKTSGKVKNMKSVSVLELPSGEKNFRNSEGSFVRLRNGRILFAYTKYGDQSWQDHARADIALRISSDGGRTWTASDKILVECGDPTGNVMSVSFLRLQDGRIAFLYLRKTSLPVAGTSVTDCRPVIRYSSDEGETWTDEQNIIPYEHVSYHVVANDRLVQLKSGRLLVPVSIERHVGTALCDPRSIVVVYYSDDGGATWTEAPDWILPAVTDTWSGLQEPGVIELADGRVMLWARTSAGHQYKAFSADGGLNWTDAECALEFPSPCSPLSMKRTPDGKSLCAVWNDHSDGRDKLPPSSGGWGRTPLGIAFSRDDGKTWEKSFLIETDPECGFCYIAMEFLSDETLLLAYCCGGRGGKQCLQDLRIVRIEMDHDKKAESRPEGKKGERAIKHLEAIHETLFRGTAPFGYFGWPTVAKLADGTLAAAASGFRAGHICPFGKTTLFLSSDEGKTWKGPIIVNDSSVDDRDAGLCALPDGSLLISHFGSDTRGYYPAGPAEVNGVEFRGVLDSWTEDSVRKNIGSFLRLRKPDGSFGARIPVAASAPHGPSLLPDGSLLYAGNRFGVRGADGVLKFEMSGLNSEVVVLRCTPDGETWEELSVIPNILPGSFFCEPHVLGLPSGRILCHLRQNGSDFSIWQSESGDGGRTWSKPVRLASGAPAHLMRHSSGTLVSTFGCRSGGEYGQRALLSHDDGRTWDTECILRDDGPSGDLGYPSTVELSDGTLYTVYYQQPESGAPCALLATRWKLPESEEK